MATGEVPEDQRKANVTPIFKKDRKDKAGNYRPVSLTSNFGKVMEQLTQETISKHTNDKKIKSSQHGCTKRKSGLTSFINLHGEMPGLLDEEKAVDIFCLDFSKAFYAVSCKILLHKLPMLSA